MDEFWFLIDRAENNAFVRV